jgi:hypothetical protein
MTAATSAPPQRNNIGKKRVARIKCHAMPGQGGRGDISPIASSQIIDEFFLRAPRSIARRVSRTSRPIP